EIIDLLRVVGGAILSSVPVTKEGNFRELRVAAALCCHDTGRKRAEAAHVERQSNLRLKPAGRSDVLSRHFALSLLPVGEEDLSHIFRQRARFNLARFSGLRNCRPLPVTKLLLKCGRRWSKRSASYRSRRDSSCARRRSGFHAHERDCQRCN